MFALLILLSLDNFNLLINSLDNFSSSITFCRKLKSGFFNKYSCAVSFSTVLKLLTRNALG